VEDVVTSRLYLELGNGSPETVRGRSRDLSERSGVERVTWWQNCKPGRTDMPRRVEDGSMLIVAEVDARFTPTEPQAGTTAHTFRRYPRPSQGNLTGRPTTGLLVVWISPREPDLKQTLRDWGDFIHIRHIAAAGIPGFTQISVYENVAPVDPTFLHFYEFDSNDPEATFSTMIDHVAPRLGGTESDDFGYWADWRAGGGRLFYCNTFRLVGENAAEIDRLQ
jgi:hypothetical protein